MSYRERQEQLVKSLREIPELAKAKGKDDKFTLDLMLVTLQNYAPQMIDMGIEMDRPYEENERLKKIVDLIELKNENDAMKAKLARLESASA